MSIPPHVEDPTSNQFRGQLTTDGFDLRQLGQPRPPSLGGRYRSARTLILDRKDPAIRDRNAWGRPENSRPRDRTGRPLPYDTDVTELTEEWTYDTVEEALAAARWLWDEQRYFEAHECLEDVWHHAPEDERMFWQGVIQVAVACVHHQRDNADGVVATCAKALRNLAPYPDVHHGIDVEQLRVFCEGVAQVVEEAGCVEIGYPEFPAMDDGPWFDADRLRTPLTRRPPWQVAAEERQAGKTT